MNEDAFRCMRQGKNIAQLQPHDLQSMQEIKIEDGKKTRALILLHGFSSTPAVFRYFIPKIAGYNAIYAPVLPGHGQSIDAFAKVTAKQWISTVKDYIKEQVSGYQSVDVVGLSLGGVLAYEAVKSIPIRRLFLLAPAFDLRVSLPYSLMLAKAFQYMRFTSLRSAAGNICADNTYEIAYKQTPLPVLIEILTLIKTFEFTAPNCPVELFLGKHDNVIDNDTVAALFASNAQTTLHCLENSAHVLPLDADRDAIIARINQCNSKKCGETS